MSTHVFVRSCYSFLNSTIQIEKLVQRAKQTGYHAVALTDHNVLYGAASFLRACRREGIKPIIGLEADVAIEEKTFPFLLLAETNQGAQNLVRLSGALCSGSYPKGIPLDAFASYCEKNILIVYGEGGYIDHELIQDDDAGIKAKLSFLVSTLGTFYVAVSYQDSVLWRRKNTLLKQCCRALRLSTVAVHKIVYLEEKDAAVFQVVRAIETGLRLDDPSLPLLTGRRFLSMPEFAKLYDEDDLRETDRIADRCKADWQFEKTSLPNFPIPEQLRPDQYLTQLCLAGLKKRLGGHVLPAYYDHLRSELKVISDMHFADYFLIVYDFIRHSRQQGIFVGPGRGSAVGSLVAYCLGITMVDPLQYHLLFERFLNPERVSMPDIDTDFPDDRRQEVIDYVYTKYGHAHVAGVVAFDTFRARQALLDVGKAMSISPRELDTLRKFIPPKPTITLSEVKRDSPRLRALLAANPRYARLFDMAEKIEGLPRNATRHAAGIILSRLDMRNILPLTQFGDGMATSQFPKEFLEDRGFIKMDFLGLRNLTIIAAIVKAIQKDNPSFDIMQIPLDDAKTYAIFAAADTMGIFQFEKAGMKSLLKKMKPHCFDDIVATLALYRPASMQSVPLYLANRADPKRVTYPLPVLEPILKETYGIMLYQEQTMRTVQAAAGFSLGKADILRKAISKKDAGALQNMQADFMAGCKKNGHPEEAARHLWEQIERFGGYGFNKSHAVAYGLISYQMAWLKANYPLDFYCALLDGVIGDQKKTATYVDACRRRSIVVAHPSVVYSTAHYSRHEKQIRMPLAAIRDIGTHGAASILDEREKRPFTDFFDFVARVSLLKITEKMIGNLIDAGALDSFHETRTTLHEALAEALRYAELVRVEKNGTTLLDTSLISKPIIQKYSDSSEKVSEAEKAVLGFNLGVHPIIAMRKKHRISFPSLVTLQENGGAIEGFAYVSSMRRHRTRKGDLMAFLTLTDETADLDMMVMPITYQGVMTRLQRGVYVHFKAQIKADGSCIADRITIL